MNPKVEEAVQLYHDFAVLQAHWDQKHAQLTRALSALTGEEVDEYVRRTFDPTWKSDDNL